MVTTASLFLGCTAASNQATSTALDPLAGQCTIKGGGSAMPAVKSLTDTFARAHAGVTFDWEDVGSDGGVGLTAEDGVDLGMISRDLKPAEVGRVETLLIGTSATGVVVNASNPVCSLTRSQLRFTPESVARIDAARARAARTPAQLPRAGDASPGWPIVLVPGLALLALGVLFRRERRARD